MVWDESVLFPTHPQVEWVPERQNEIKSVNKKSCSNRNMAIYDGLTAVNNKMPDHDASTLASRFVFADFCGIKLQLHFYTQGSFELWKGEIKDNRRDRAVDAQRKDG